MDRDKWLTGVYNFGVKDLRGLTTELEQKFGIGTHEAHEVVKRWAFENRKSVSGLDDERLDPFADFMTGLL